jgi:hypothetical protein
MPPGPTKKRAKEITKTALADKKYQVTPFDQLLKHQLLKHQLLKHQLSALNHQLSKTSTV